MLATGGSAVAAINLLKSKGCTNIRLNEHYCGAGGVEAVAKAHPDVRKIYIQRWTDVE
jgi:uracil phosphoribosyltransferase